MTICTENLSNLLKATHQAAVKLEYESRSSRAHALDLYPRLSSVLGPVLRETLMRSSPGTPAACNVREGRAAASRRRSPGLREKGQTGFSSA